MNHSNSSRSSARSVLLLLLWIPGSAWAVDLGSLVEAWTRTIDGQGGTDGNDAALGTVLDSSGNTIAVGWLDGAEGHGSDGYAVAWDPTGAVVWDLVEDVGEIGADRLSSDDRLNAITIDPIVDDLAFCGARGPEDLDDPHTRYLVENWLPNAGAVPLLDWTVAYADGPSSSDQACFGAVRSAGFVYATGWAVHDALDAGRWFSWKFDEANGQILEAIPYEFSSFEAVPDQGYDIAVHTASGAFAAVGTRGFSGLAGSLENDTDWHVRYYEPDGTLRWEHTLAGVAQLEDRALGAVIDPTTGDLYVVGSINNGDDNGPNADLDWQMIRYDSAGDGLGGAFIVWERTFASAPGASEGATAVVLDDGVDVLVGGWQVDAASGVDRWRVAKLDAYDGGEVASWLGTVRAGDSRVTSLDYRDGRIAIAGTTDDGAGLDFAGTVLEGDSDEDGVANSVDACPDDPDKAADPGVCGCNVPDLDADGDGVESCIDDCPQDPEKIELGVCGCGNVDEDGDGDGAYDCNDDCPTDPDKTTVGTCGCDTPDADGDGDGVIDCTDACLDTPAGTEVDALGCPLEAGAPTGDTGEAPTDGGTKDGCGCATGPTPGFGALLGFVLLVLRRRHPGL